MPNDLRSDDVVNAALELHRIMRSRMTALAETGVNMLQIHALFGLHERPGMTMKEFARMLHITSPSATAFVSRLSRLGLVKRAHDLKNRKLVRLRMTPKGEAKLQAVGAVRNRILGDVFSAIPAADRKTFVRILRHVVSSQPSSSL